MLSLSPLKIIVVLLVALGVSSMWIDLLHPLNSAVG